MASSTTVNRLLGSYALLSPVHLPCPNNSSENKTTYSAITHRASRNSLLLVNDVQWLSSDRGISRKHVPKERSSNTPRDKQSPKVLPHISTSNDAQRTFPFNHPVSLQLRALPTNPPLSLKPTHQNNPYSTMSGKGGKAGGKSGGKAGATVDAKGSSRSAKAGLQ